MRPGEEEIVELVNVVLDGEATPEEENELNDLLRSSDQARQIHGQVRDVVSRLEAVPAVQPPAALGRNVMTSIRRPAPVMAFDPARGRRRLLFGLAWAAAAAFMVAVLLIDPPSFVSRRDAQTHAGATMAPAEVSNWPLVTTIRSQKDGTEASLVVRRSGDLYLIEGFAAGPRPMTISIAWDSKNVSSVGFLAPVDPSSWNNTAQFVLTGPEDRAGVIVRAEGPGEGLEVWMAVGETEVIRSVVPLK